MLLTLVVIGSVLGVLVNAGVGRANTVKKTASNKSTKKSSNPNYENTG